MSRMYDFSSSNRTKIPFRDLQGVLNGQFQIVTDLFTGICLCLRILSYCKSMFWYLVEIRLGISGWVTISYSKVIFVILYVASGVDTCPDAVIIFP